MKTEAHALVPSPHRAGSKKSPVDPRGLKATTHGQKGKDMLLFSDDWPWRNEKNHTRAIQNSADNHKVRSITGDILGEILPYTSARLAKKRTTYYREFWSGELQPVNYVRGKVHRNKKDKDAHYGEEGGSQKENT